LIATAPGVQLDSAGRVRQVSDNLLAGVDLSSIRASLEAGAGHELEGKILSPHSSTALVVNAFAPWLSRAADLSLGGRRGFDSLMFEAPVEVFPRTLATPAHLDLLARGQSGIVAVESKLLEILSHPEPEFTPAYDRFAKGRESSPWSRWIVELRRDPNRFKWLDAAQLVKHALALRRECAGQEVVLVYMFWEPRNAMAFENFREHRAEAEEFRQSVISDDLVHFEVERHISLWAEWRSTKESQWPSEHALRLLKRYDIELVE
jgi:hypothetical protein